MSEFLYWKEHSETRRIYRLIEEEINKLEQELALGTLLNTKNNDHLAREYAKNIGTIRGLKFIERLFQHDDDSERERNE